ncbi:MAG: DNA repair protein RecO [Proteobacteria bacterium]|nr:DNA repair protein RecO [Pseudomonadota bacterium]
MKVDLTPAYILHHRPYRETSLLLDVFSQDHGRVSLIAKGVRNKKRSQQGLFQLYQPLLLSWFGRGELYTLNTAEASGPQYLLKANSTLCGLYLNELQVRLLPLNEPEPDIFNAYQLALAGLQAEQNNEVVLRLFEKRLLTQLGYGFSLEFEALSGDMIHEHQQYYFQPDVGLLPWQQGLNRATISGRSLQHLFNESDFDQASLLEIKQLMRSVINHYLGGKPLQSRQLFAQLQQYAAKH